MSYVDIWSLSLAAAQTRSQLIIIYLPHHSRQRSVEKILVVVLISNLVMLIACHKPPLTDH